MSMWRIILIILLSNIIFLNKSIAQHSVARRWNEVQLAAIRQDLARPPVQARNLFHVSMAMYDAWAAYNPIATTYLLGKTINGVLYNYNGIAPILGGNVLASQEMAISYAAYKLLRARYSISPNSQSALYRFDTLMLHLGYDTSIHTSNYITGTPAEFGNYIADQIINMGNNDGARQPQNYSNGYYLPMNPLLWVDSAGTNGMLNLNRWQPLHIVSAVDQNGNPIAANQVALCHEWGNVVPFNLSNPTGHFRNGNIYNVFQDPGGPSKIDTSNGFDVSSLHYKWANAMVSVWGSFHDPNDTTMIDISPNTNGNLITYPSTLTEQYNYYDYLNGGDTSHGHIINPVTGLPYVPQIVKRGDYTRVVSQYWADGPQSETPPGHWYVIINKVADNPLTIKKFEGIGNVLSNLEWDIKTYFTMGGAVHDAAISAWALKGWYDSPRPISAIRAMAALGQSSDSTLPHFHKAGLPLIPGYIELITATDSMAIANPSNLNKIKVKSWKGFAFITNAATDVAGCGWILAENWIPYQRKGFVTPPFAGYVSGHSTYSRAGAEVMTKITNDPYFPGGILETVIPANSGFLQFEKGPSTQIKLQWATYRDASNEASLSRIYGGIHPPTDDATGRVVGETIGVNSVNYARTYFNSFALPVALTYFNSVDEKCKVNLMWSTSEERNNAGFEIWRSENGIDFTTKIADISANGFSNDVQNYMVVDNNPDSKNFYKLIQIDIDGKKTIVAHSSTNVLGCDETSLETLSIYPIPTADNLTINFANTSDEQIGTIKIIDVLGNIVHKQETLFTKQNTQTNIDVHSLPIGNYFIQILTEDGAIYTKKFVKN